MLLVSNNQTPLFSLKISIKTVGSSKDDVTWISFHLQIFWWWTGQAEVFHLFQSFFQLSSRGNPSVYAPRWFIIVWMHSCIVQWIKITKLKLVGQDHTRRRGGGFISDNEEDGRGWLKIGVFIEKGLIIGLTNTRILAYLLLMIREDEIKFLTRKYWNIAKLTIHRSCYRYRSMIKRCVIKMLKDFNFLHANVHTTMIYSHKRNILQNFRETSIH